MATKSIRLSDGTDTLLPESAQSGNGYQKFADGTLICWGTKQESNVAFNSWGSLYVGTMSDTVTFPIEFAANPSVIVSAAISGTSFFPITAASNTTGIYTLQVAKTNNTTSTIIFQWVAIGRWK